MKQKLLMAIMCFCLFSWVNAQEKFNYRLLDINGRTIETGNGQMGTSRINLTNRASGMYVLQLLSASAKQSERILKQ